MAVFKCKMCGGALDIQEGSSVAVCSFCGTKQTVPKLDNETRINLYDRANHFRRNNDYDKAMSIYEQLLEADKTDAEAYWSILLCKYGVEYVEDPQTHKMMPTINRAQYTSIFADEDYKSAIQYADGYQREVYENEAKELDKIQKGILAISQKEDPFDIFICYKETDAYGRRTQDSVLAQDLYYQLTKEGFKVFFSRITLEDKLGTAYEPYIFAALNTAKIMVVIGTSKENLNSVWVKNEWSRFLALTKKDNSKVLIPAYRDMDPYDLPEEFSHLQAQDMSKLGFMQDLIRGIKKILVKDEKVVVVSQNSSSSQSANVDALLKRAYIACEDGDFAKADNFAEQILNINPELAEAYVVKLLAECKVRKLDGLRTYGAIVKSRPNFQRAYKYAKDDLKSQLASISKENFDYINFYPIYNKAQGFIGSGAYGDALILLEKIPNYKDSSALIAQCKEKIDALKKENTYTNAINTGFAKNADEATMQKSIESLKSLNGYKDSLAQIDKLYARIEKYRYQKQVEAEKAKELAVKRKHKRKIGAIVTATCAVVLVAVLLMTFFWFIPLSEYNDAENLVKSRKYEEALAKYKDLNGFSESDAHIAALNAVLSASEHFEEGNLDAGLNEVYSQNGTITVHYDCGAGQISQDDEANTVSSKLEQGEELTIPYRAGYAFVKWELVGYSVSYNLKAVSAKVSLLAIWAECDYTVSFDLDGGYLSYKPSGYRYESEDITIGPPIKTGYTFLGWSGTEIDELTTDLVIKQGSEGDRHYVAHWQANTYTVTFNLNGGTMDATQLQVTYDAYVSLPTPKKSGSTFSGWYCEGKKIDSGEWNLTKDCTLDAQWDLITYTISYNLNGGTNASGNPSSYTAYDEFSLQEPTKTGYTFLGWSGNNVSETTKKVTIPKGSIGNRSYTAVWQANSYTINYDADGGTINETVQNVTFDESVTLYSAKKTGYTFAGWYYGDTKLSSGIWKITNNVSVKAKWVANSNTKYMVYHYLENANDSEYTLTKTQTLYGTTATSVSPSVESYAYFTIPAKQTITISGDGTSFVKYYYKREKFTLTLYPNNGAAIQSKTFKYGQSIADKTSWYNKTDFSFGGWFTDENLTTEYSNTTMGPSSVILYAYWNGETKPSLLSYTKAISSVTITGCNNSVSSVVIPTHIANIPVKSIKNLSSSILQSVVLPNSVATIEDNAFSNAKSLRTINLNNVETIGNNAFLGCSALQNPTFEQLKSLGEYAFKDCSALTNIVLPDTLTGNLNYCFYNCNALENISISKNLTSICEGSFFGCGSLKEMTLPFTGTSSVDDSSDHHINNNFGIIFGKNEYDGSGAIGYSEGGSTGIYDTTYATFYVPISLTKITIYGDVQSYAFSNCQYLTSVIVKNAQIIGKSAFTLCTNLTTVKFETNALKTIDSYAFWRCDKLVTLYIPKTIKTIGGRAFYCLGSGTEIPQIDLFYEGSEEDWNAVNKAPFDIVYDTKWDDGRTIVIHYDCDSTYR